MLHIKILVKRGPFCNRKNLKIYLKYLHTLVIMEQTNPYQNGFNNFHFLLQGFELFLQILEIILRKNRVEREFRATGIRVTGGPSV